MASVMFSDWRPIVWNLSSYPTFKSMLIEDELVTKKFIHNGGLLLVLLKAIDSFGATGII